MTFVSLYRTRNLPNETIAYICKSLSAMEKDTFHTNSHPGYSSAKQGNVDRTADTEGAVAKLWQAVLGLPSVGLEDNFFEMGGTSLLATVLLTKLNQAFDADLAIAAVFEHPTVRSMAR